MNIDTNQLRQLAEMAAPGPWTINPNTDARFMVFSRRDDPLFIGAQICEARAPLGCAHGYRLIEVAREANAAFIAAANPATVLELLAEIDRLTTERDEWRAAAMAVANEVRHD